MHNQFEYIDTEELIDEIHARGEISIVLKDISTQDLSQELKSRGENIVSKELVWELYEKLKLGKNYETELKEIIYQALGKIV